MDLIALDDLTSDDVAAIFASVDDARPPPTDVGAVGWSFEGSGIRTRASFVQAFRDLGLAYTELPGLLATDERVGDLAGYLDPFFGLYVIRASDHDRLAAFARASRRPVINAMSSRGHPCEVLADACFIGRSVAPLRTARIALWGPTTNVFRSWHELARMLDLTVFQVCAETHHEAGCSVTFVTVPPPAIDIVITDAPPAAVASNQEALSIEHLQRMGRPALLPTPPFSIGRELLFDPTGYAGFVGYGQKALLRPVQSAIIRHLLAAG